MKLIGIWPLRKGFHGVMVSTLDFESSFRWDLAFLTARLSNCGLRNPLLLQRHKKVWEQQSRILSHLKSIFTKELEFFWRISRMFNKESMIDKKSHCFRYPPFLCLSTLTLTKVLSQVYIVPCWVWCRLKTGRFSDFLTCSSNLCFLHKMWN